MCERRWRSRMVIALTVFMVAGCAPAAISNSPASSDAGGVPPATEAPSNFASPTDMLQRYPSMRRQQL